MGGCWLSVVGGFLGSLCFFSSSSYFRLISWFSIILGCRKWFKLFFVSFHVVQSFFGVVSVVVGCFKLFWLLCVWVHII